MVGCIAISTAVSRCGVSRTGCASGTTIVGLQGTKLHLHRAGLVARANKRSAHRKKRPRRPMVGMMLHRDASKGHARLSQGHVLGKIVLRIR
jgi:hypothetical protein